jgi:hypothetical protein
MSAFWKSGLCAHTLYFGPLTVSMNGALGGRIGGDPLDVRLVPVKAVSGAGGLLNLGASAGVDAARGQGPSTSLGASDGLGQATSGPWAGQSPYEEIVVLGYE